VNWQQLQALLWLRWRLMANQWRRAGTLNFILMTIVTVSLVAMAVPLFIGSVVGGVFAFPRIEPLHLLFVWDGLVVGFLFVWMIGLVTELQRTEPLSLLKFLHLPVSVNGAFLINYIASLARLSLIFFLPVMLGLCISLVVVNGAMLLVAMPLLAAFLLMITALTYQFQGWLASLMTNPRRRRTVLVVTTMSFVLIAQLPNLFNMLGLWGLRRGQRQPVSETAEWKELQRSLSANEIDANEFSQRQQALLQRRQHEDLQANRQFAEQAESKAVLVNQVLPLGWLPLGVKSAAEGNALPAILGCLGMTLIGAASLRRAYRTTIRLYTGDFSTGNRKPAAAKVAISKKSTDRKAGVGFLEWRLPGLSEPVSAVTLGTFRSLMRSPETKMMLLTLFIMAVAAIGLMIFGPRASTGPLQIPVLFRPLFAIGGMIMILFGMLQIMSNQFGLDRDGFRVFVLCAARRRDILFGKNLALAVPTFGTALLLLFVLEIVKPMQIDHFLAMFPLYISMYLLFCLMANLISIYAPLHIAPGTFKPANPKLKTVLLQMLLFMFLFPLAQIPTLLPLGIEAAAEQLGWTKGVPIFLLLALLECAVICGLYKWLINWQGDLLQRREQQILETVTNK
jgi:hypothetical protein